MMRLLQRLERVFRLIVVYPFFRLLFRSRPLNSTVDIAKIRRLLILRHDRIGDMIVTTPIFRNLKRLQPHLHIGVFASTSNSEIIRHDSNVDVIYVLHRNIFRLFNEIRRARREEYEVVLSFVFNRTTSVALLARLVGPKALRISHADDKYEFYFDRLVKFPRRSTYMVELLATYVREVFGIELRSEDLQYEIQIDASSTAAVNQFLTKHRLRRRSTISDNLLPYVVFNLSANVAVCKISVAQAKAVASHLAKNRAYKTVVIRAPEDREMEHAISSDVDFGDCIRYPENGVASLLEVASLIQGALCVITPDTAIVHFASAAKTPVLGLFTTVQDMPEWLPFGVTYDLVTADRGLPASAIPKQKIIASIEQFLQRIGLKSH